jgi:hypothetical protein
MSIVSSIIADTAVQIDGRKWVREEHTDHVGVKWERTYLAGALDDLNAALAAYAVILAGNLTAQEIASNVSSVTSIGSLAVPTFVYSTTGQNLTALRAAYAASTQQQAIMIGDFLSSLTDGQLQTIFSMTSGQVTSLRSAKLTPAATLAASIRIATGA